MRRVESGSLVCCDIKKTLCLLGVGGEGGFPLPECRLVTDGTVSLLLFIFQKNCCFSSF